MHDIRPLTLANRRNNPGTDGAPSIYQACLNALARLGDHSLARHEINRTCTARQVGNTYDPDMFSEHRGDYFDHSLDIKIIQRDHRDVDNSLTPPWELKKILTEGTFFSAQVTLQTYTFSGNGVPNKIYHIYVDKLRVLDRGYGTAWQIPVPSLPAAGPSTPGKKRKERHEAADDAFQAFDAVSPKKKF
ncbi:hypothetical protein B0H14DRAFT_3492673 [Mycena olivaceomarginata]|nr:hypothetical protein B0H14DRAFT_3492673 [Mycena olivaceomarginata]